MQCGCLFFFFFFFLNNLSSLQSGQTFIYLFIYLWLCWVFVPVRGLSLVAASGGHSPSWCAGLFTIAASLVAEHRLQTRRLSSCGSRAQLLRGMWDLPRPGLEPVSSALAGRFSTTAPPGESAVVYSYWINVCCYNQDPLHVLCRQSDSYCLGMQLVRLGRQDTEHWRVLSLNSRTGFGISICVFWQVI